MFLAVAVSDFLARGGPVYPHPIIRGGGGLKNDNSKPCGFGLKMRWGPRIPRISNLRCINKDFDSKKILCELIPRGKKLLPMKINTIFNDSQLKKRQNKMEQRINSGVKIHVLQIIEGGYNYRIFLGIFLAAARRFGCPD